MPERGEEKTVSDFDELEKQIMDRMREVYSEKVIDHAYKPRNVGRIKDADGFGRITGPCGDTMEITLRVRGLSEERVLDVAFWTDGCGTSIACGSITTELVKGKQVSDALKADSETILNALGGLPESDVHCAVLAANTLRAAIQNYRNSKNNRVKIWPAVPVEVKEFKGNTALVDFGGGTLEEVNISLVNVQVGDYVQVQEGYAIQVMDGKTAEKTLKLWSKTLGHNY